MVLLPRSPFELADQWLRALRHPAQARLHLVPAREAVQPFRAGAQLARRLLTAEQQHREQGPLVLAETEHLVEDLVVLQHPPPGVGPHDPEQSALLECPRGPLDRLLVEVDDGSRLLVWLHALRSAFAVRGYVAGTVVCFSSRLPRMRWSSGARTGSSVTLLTLGGQMSHAA